MINLIILVAFPVAVLATEFELRNNCPHPIWVGIQGNIFNGRPMPDGAGGGLALNSGQSQSIRMNNWGGRFWARTGCDQSGRNCATGDCTELKCGGKGNC